MKIVQFIPGAGSWGDVTPDTMNEKGLGGRETALVQLAEAWSRMGHEVINFVPTSRSYRYPKKSGGISYYVPGNFAYDHLRLFGADVCVSWEEPRIFGVPEVRQMIGLAVIEMQVANMSTMPELDEATDVYAVLSEWAGEYLCQQDANINPEKIVVLPNGVDLNRYSRPNFTRNWSGDSGYRFYYSSSPDRGLNHLLHLWPKLLNRLPDSELYVAYGVEHWLDAVKWTHNMQAEAALAVAEGLNQPGVIYTGRIGQNELARLQERSDALLYPCDTMQPTETGCITVVEAGAACTPAIITDADCLGSEFNQTTAQVSLPFNEDEYIDLVEEIVKDDKAYRFYQEANHDLAASRDWRIIAEDWLMMFDKALYATV
jgi:glycosyltransferase involved in cell wall biosynthesis